MKKVMLSLCAMLFFGIASAQTDSIRTGKKEANKSENRMSTTKKTSVPKDTIMGNRTDNRRTNTAPSMQPNNSTDPAKRSNPPGTFPATPPPPGTPVPPSPASPVSPTGQP